MQYWSTQYPFNFIFGNNSYAMPFPLKYNNTPLSNEKLQFWKMVFSPPDWDVLARRLDIELLNGDDVFAIYCYHVNRDNPNDYSVTVNVLTASKNPFSVKMTHVTMLKDGSEFVSNDYTEDSDTFTYNGERVYYNDWDWTLSLNRGGNITAVNPTNVFNNNDWAVFTNKDYYTWLLIYGDNPYTNDPYNRPPQDTPQRGGHGTWDNSSDTITVDPLPAGLWGQGFVSVYCPTTTELHNFASQIWDSSNRATLNDIFPQGVTSGIVDCITVPVSPPVTGSTTICIGGIAIPNTSANVLASRFVVADFGNITNEEYFGGFPDYANTKIAIYLPYIGFQQLAPEMVINATINLQYKIDCMTGDCVAILTTNRADKFSYSGISYIFNGNCATSIPIAAQTGAGRSDYISAAISGLYGMTAHALSGNYAGVVASGANMVNSIMADNDKHSFALKGGFSGAKGQLSSQRAYLVINRPCMENGGTNGYFELEGVPSNDYVSLSSCSGFTKIMSAELTNSNFVHATENEMNEILTLLKKGVFF